MLMFCASNIKLKTTTILKKLALARQSQIFVSNVFWPRVRALALRAPVFFGLFTGAGGAARPRPACRCDYMLTQFCVLNHFMAKILNVKFDYLLI